MQILILGAAGMPDRKLTQAILSASLQLDQLARAVARAMGVATDHAPHLDLTRLCFQTIAGGPGLCRRVVFAWSQDDGAPIVQVTPDRFHLTLPTRHVSQKARAELLLPDRSELSGRNRTAARHDLHPARHAQQGGVRFPFLDPAQASEREARHPARPRHPAPPVRKPPNQDRPLPAGGDAGGPRPWPVARDRSGSIAARGARAPLTFRPIRAFTTPSASPWRMNLPDRREDRMPFPSANIPRGSGGVNPPVGAAGTAATGRVPTVIPCFATLA